MPGLTRPRLRLTRETRLDWVIGVLVVAGYAVVQLFLLQGPRPYDPAIYFQSAASFPDVSSSLLTLRIGLVAPVAAAVRLFGPSEAALYALPLAAGLLLTAAAYGMTLVLFRDRVLAVAAALVTVLNGYYLLNSSFIFPDTLATAAFTAGFLCLLLGGRRDEGRAATVYALSAGVLFGWAFLIKESSLILVPVVVAALALVRYPPPRVALLVGAALATFSVDPIYGLLRYGTPFIHARLLLTRSDTPPEAGQARRLEHVREQLDTPLDTLLVFPRLLLSGSGGWVFLLLVALLLFALVRLRDRRLWLLAAWFFGFWAVMAAIGLGWFPSGRPILNITNIRYWYPILPPLVAGAFGGLGLLVRKSVLTVPLAHALAAVAVALALVPGLVEYRRCAAADAWASDPLARWHDLRSWLATPEAGRYDVIRSDSKTKRFIPAFARTTFGGILWEGRVGRFAAPRAGDIPPAELGRTLILVHEDRPPPARALNELRERWSPVFVSTDEGMVVVAHESVAATEAVGGEPAWWSLPAAGGAADTRSCRLRPYAPVDQGDARGRVTGARA